MTFKMVKTEYEGHPIQYEHALVQPLNEIVGAKFREGRGFSTLGKEIKNSISEFVSVAGRPVIAGRPETADGYVWYNGFNFKVNDTKVAVLFPWHLDHKHSETTMDRSINVYSDKQLPDASITDILDKIGNIYNTKFTVEAIAEADRVAEEFDRANPW